MNNKEFSKLLEKRTRDFGVRIIRISASLPNTPEGREIRGQITKSGTSIGANYLPFLLQLAENGERNILASL